MSLTPGSLQHRSILPSGPVAPNGANAEAVPTRKEAISALQHELHLPPTGEMSPDLLKAINDRFDEIGDDPSDKDQNFVSMLQGLFDLGFLSDTDAEGPLRRSLDIFSRTMRHRGMPVPDSVTAAAGMSGAAFMGAYRGINPGFSGGVTPGSSGGSVLERVGGHIGLTHQCAALTQAMAPTVGLTTEWRRGDQVMGNTTLQPGTAIATFNFASGPGQTGYGPEGHREGWYGVSHTGIYLGQDRNGMYVLDQWNSSAGAQVRYMSFNGTGAEAANRYFVINTANRPGQAHVAASLPTQTAQYIERARTQLAGQDGPNSRPAVTPASATDPATTTPGQQGPAPTTRRRADRVADTEVREGSDGKHHNTGGSSTTTTPTRQASRLTNTTPV